MNLKSLLLAGSTLLTAATAASAGGFQVNLGGQRNIGMGGVGVGLSLDQAAMFYNPGALAMVRRNGVQLSASMARLPAALTWRKAVAVRASCSTTS